MSVPFILSEVPDVTPYIQYIATNGQTVFPYPFPITQDSDLVVVANGVTLNTDSGYTLSGQGNDNGGNVTFTLGRTAGDIITLFRDIQIQRVSQISQNSGFSSTVFNAEYNNIYLILQQLEASIAQCLQVPNTNNPAPVTTLTPANYANKYQAYDAFGNPTPALLTSSGSLTAGIITGLIGAQTAAEAAVSATVISTAFAVGNVVRYGADPTGVSDSTAVINKALLVGGPVYFPTGTYKVTDKLTCSINGQLIYGDGRTKSIIKAAASFNLSAVGVFVATCGEPGPVFQDIEVTCDQSGVASSGTRTNLIAYPPAFSLRNTPRFVMNRMRITQFPFGVDMQGNSGGAFIQILENTCYTCGLVIDGSLDTVRVEQHQYWNFELTTNQLAIFEDGGNTAISSGRCDDLNLTDCLSINAGKAVNCFVGAGTSLAGTPSGSGWTTGPTIGKIDGYDFDTYGGLYITSTAAAPAVLQLSSCLFTHGVAGVQALNVVGPGFVKISSSEFDAATALTNPMVQVSGGGGQGAQVIISDSIFRLTGDMIAAQVAASSGSNGLTISNCDFALTPNTSPTNPAVKQLSGGRVNFIGNRATDKGSGSGTLLSIATDDQHVVVANTFVGWGFTFPSITSACYGPNAYPGSECKTDSPAIFGSTAQILGAFGMNGATPQAAQTGWGIPTGTGVINNFSGSGATLAQTSGAVATLIARLIALGVLAA